MIGAANGVQVLKLRGLKASRVVIFDESIGSDNPKKKYNRRKSFLSGPGLVFLLLDARQCGSTLTWLHKESAVVDTVRNLKAPVVFVIKEMATFLEEDDLYGAWVGIQEVLNNIDIKPVRLIVNHRSPVYSVLFDAIYRKRIRTITDEKRLFESIASIAPTGREYKRITKLVREIRNHKWRSNDGERQVGS
jgi:hypothetical protein